MVPDSFPDFSASVRHCQSICRRHAKSFYLASWALPRQKRVAAWVVYAFSRVSDDLVDAGGPDADENFARWRIQVKAAFDSGQPDDLVLSAFVPICRTYGIPRRLVFQLLGGLADDLSKDRYRTFAELKKYCFKVAAVPGLMMLRVLGCTDLRAKRHAQDLGIAMQLTNILRDVKEDASRGKIYLPLEDLDAAGYSESDLHAGVRSAAFDRFMAMHLRRARALYASADAGIAYLPSDARLCVRLCSAFYRGILDELSQPGFSPLQGRAVVPFSKKAAIAARLVFSPNPS